MSNTCTPNEVVIQQPSFELKQQKQEPQPKKPSNPIKFDLIGNTCDLFNYYKYIKYNDNFLSQPSEMKENFEDLYNDIHDLENNIVYIEENFKPEHMNEIRVEDEEEYIPYCNSTDEEDEVETNEWMFNY